MVDGHAGSALPERLSVFAESTCSTLPFGSRMRLPAAYLWFACHPAVVFFAKYAGSRGSLRAFMMSTSTLPATRSCPNVVVWNWYQMLRSDVDVVWNASRSPAGLAMPALA